jgi:glycosyltransferase involved in cell wall biosynthesis
MPRITFIASNEYVPWGGSESLWAGAAEKLVRRGFEVVVSVKDWGVPVKQVEQLRAAGCRIFKRSSAGFIRRAFRKLPPWRKQAIRHIRTVSAGTDLIVISQGSDHDGLHWMEAARSSGYKYASVVQAAAEAWWPDDDTAERMADLYEAASCAFFVSEANLALMRRQLVVPIPRARIVRNPFNVSYDASPSWPSSSSDELRCACIGRLDAAAKGQDVLFQTLDLPRWRERKIHVTVFGSGRTERGLRRWAEVLNLPNLSFGGFTENIGEIWSRHHALILPSRWEGMPLVIVEAMLCGRPCVATDVAGARELLRDNINGFLVKAPTVELLDETMNRAWENRHRLREMGEQAAIDARQFVGPDPIEDFVRELLALVDGQPK